MELTKIQKPFTFLLFGASGDLAKLKIFPALYEMAWQGRFPEEYSIVGFARTTKEREQFQEEFRESVIAQFADRTDTEVLENLLRHVHYLYGDYSSRDDFRSLRSSLQKINPQSIFPLLCYFAVPPSVFHSIVENLAKTRKDKTEDIRLILEKPFGISEKSAMDLFQFIREHFEDHQLYLLDHYLGKDSIRSIYFLRRYNNLLHILLKPENIANIQISAIESMGVKERAHYFDQVGTIKDMIQSHLLQILAFITMSIPLTDDPSSVHREKLAVLSSLKLEPGEDVAIGQYQSYCSEDDVPSGSQTETFAALRCFLDRSEWAHIPIYLRTGKKLHDKRTYIVIELKQFEFQHDNTPNRVIIQTHPVEQLSFTMLNQQGLAIDPSSLSVSESLTCEGDDCLPEHGLLLLDVLREDKTYFLECGEVTAAWRLIDQVMAQIQSSQVKLEQYPDASHGPEGAVRLLRQDGFEWYEI